MALSQSSQFRLSRLNPLRLRISTLYPVAFHHGILR